MRATETERETDPDREREHDKTGTMSDCKVGCVQRLEAMCFLNQMYFYIKVSLLIKDTIYLLMRKLY